MPGKWQRSSGISPRCQGPAFLVWWPRLTKVLPASWSWAQLCPSVADPLLPCPWHGGKRSQGRSGGPWAPAREPPKGKGHPIHREVPWPSAEGHPVIGRASRARGAADRCKGSCLSFAGVPSFFLSKISPGASRPTDAPRRRGAMGLSPLASHPRLLPLPSFPGALLHC